MVQSPACDPTFSVVIPTYQRAALVRRALESVLAQTFPDFEVLIQDDGSTDDTAETVGAWEHDPRVRYERLPHQGRCAARNAGAARARGEYLVFLDSDDEALPTWLASFNEVLADGVGIACCGLQFQVEGFAGQTVDGYVDLPRSMRPLVNVDGVLIRAGTFVVLRRLFHAVGGYAVPIRYSENTELSLRLLPRCLEDGLEVATIRAPLVRVHSNRTQPDSAHFQGRLDASEFLIAEHGEVLRRDPAYYARYRRIAAANAARLGRYAVARGHYLEAFRWHREPRDLAAALLSLAPGLRGRLWRRSWD